MKKRLILIGNGPIPYDISGEINTFDYVFRINRMCNLLLTCSDRIDGLFMGAYRDFKEDYLGGPYKDYFKKAGQIFVTPQIKSDFREWRDYISEEQWNNIKTMDLFKRNLGNIFRSNGSTTTIRVLNELTSNPEWTDEYEIWIAGITVNGRGKLMESGAPWINTTHRFYGHKEEAFLKKLIDNGKVKLLFPDEYPRPNTGEG